MIRHALVYFSNFYEWKPLIIIVLCRYNNQKFTNQHIKTLGKLEVEIFVRRRKTIYSFKHGIYDLIHFPSILTFKCVHTHDPFIIGVDFIQTVYKRGDKECDVKIWDTAGQERFRTITYKFYRQANGVIIVFDITKEESFENVKTWMNSIYKHADPNISKVLVGNKLDLEDQRAVSKSEAMKIAAEHGMEYYETSAKINLNIQEVMQ